MCDPIPANRYQSAENALAAFKSTATASGPPATPLEDATVIQPVSKPPEKRKTPINPRPAPKKKSGALIPVLLVALLAIGGVGAYLSGALDDLLGPSLPLADPYTLIVEKKADTPPRAVGNVPSPEIQAALTEHVRDAGGQATLTIARGNISESWGPSLMQLTEKVAELEEYRIAVSGDAANVTGLTADKSLRTAVMNDLNSAFPGDFTGSVEIAQGPRILRATDIQPLLTQFSDCGQLQLVSPPALGYGFDDQIVVSGKLADAGSRVGLYDAITAMAGDRPVSIEAEALSPVLCLIEAALPRAPQGGFDISFGFGDRPDPNPTGRYFVGENPVIDVQIPQGVSSGYLYVSVVDVSGNVFHLLPNVNRQKNNVEALLPGASADRKVRVAYPLADADAARLAFLVDDSTLGKSKIVALYSDVELFGGVRPTTESAASYANALREARDGGGFLVKSLDTRILTTAKP